MRSLLQNSIEIAKKPQGTALFVPQMIDNKGLDLIPAEFFGIFGI
jgi:hypothetical protein